MLDLEAVRFDLKLELAASWIQLSQDRELHWPTEIRTPKIPVISSVDAQPHSDPAMNKKIPARQVTSPVQWELTVNKWLKKGYELGPGKVIVGIVKRMKVDKVTQSQSRIGRA